MKSENSKGSQKLLFNDLEPNRSNIDENKFKQREYFKKYYQEHKKRITELAAKWRRDNKEKRKAIVKKSYKKRYEENPEKFKQYSKEYRRKKRLEDPEKYREINRKQGEKWRLANPEKYKQSKKISSRKYKEKYREELREQGKIQHKKYYENNRNVILEKRKSKYASDPDRFREISLRWYKNNRDKAKGLNLKTKLNIYYGLSIIEYNRMVEHQGGECMICKKVPDKSNKLFSRLTVDHDHKTGKIRGLLCSKCNAGIGHFHENIDTLNAAINYLTENTNER